jgi:hypothetical protein
MCPGVPALSAAAGFVLAESAVILVNRLVSEKDNITFWRRDLPPSYQGREFPFVKVGGASTR